MLERPRHRPSATQRRGGLLPSAFVVVAFAAAIGVGTLLLLLPWAHEPGASPQALDCLFAAVSAVTVTGLATVDTATTWSAFGELVILALIQLGGLGMIASAILLMTVIRRRLGIATRLAAMQELPGSTLGQIRRRLRRLLILTLAIEATLAVLLTLVLLVRYDFGVARSVWYGVFHTVSAFNNAGFALFPDGLVGFQNDPFVLGLLATAIILGGLGLPVYLDLRRNPRQPRRWSVHTRLTLGTTGLLLVLGTLGYLLFNLTGTEPAGTEILNSAFASVTARTAGFNTIDYGAINEESTVLTCFLMIIGGGSASTAGGIKVTTFIILILVVAAEATGSRDVNVGDRRMPVSAIRTALAITVSYVFLVSFGVISLAATSDAELSDALFETVSAVATVGLSTGITPDLGAPALFVLMILMFAGRLGALTLASAFALRRTDRPYRLPEGQPLIG